jgi:hypothetical protein
MNVFEVIPNQLLRWGDMSEEFDIESWAYYDQPLNGLATSRNSGVKFWFDCEVIIEDQLWHWCLILSDGSGQSLSTKEFQEKLSRAPAWLSIVEDRRVGGQSSCTAAWIVPKSLP